MRPTKEKYSSKKIYSNLDLIYCLPILWVVNTLIKCRIEWCKDALVCGPHSRLVGSHPMSPNICTKGEESVWMRFHGVTHIMASRAAT